VQVPSNLKCWQSTQLRVVCGADSSHAAFESVAEEATRLGFAYCSFGMKGPVPLAAPRVVWCSTYPQAWQQLYDQRGYMQQDPTVRHAIVSDEPVRWPGDLYHQAPDFFDEAARHGLRHGVAIPRRDARGMVSLFSVVRSDEPLSAAEYETKKERLLWLAVLCHEGMLKSWGELLRDDSGVELSVREMDVLRWTCEGKTSSDVAQILSISEATVNFHTRNACAKLGTTNRTAAAVRAALLGLLW